MTAKSKCVHCGAEVGEWTQDCPKCGRPVANPDAPVVSDLKSKFKPGAKYAKKNTIPYVLGIAIIIIIAVIIYLVKFR
jgi:uncharacterized membrane protein YvbJ